MLEMLHEWAGAGADAREIGARLTETWSPCRIVVVQRGAHVVDPVNVYLYMWPNSVSWVSTDRRVVTGNGKHKSNTLLEGASC